MSSSNTDDNKNGILATLAGARTGSVTDVPDHRRVPLPYPPLPTSSSPLYPHHNLTPAKNSHPPPQKACSAASKIKNAVPPTLRRKKRDVIVLQIITRPRGFLGGCGIGEFDCSDTRWGKEKGEGIENYFG